MLNLGKLIKIERNMKKSAFVILLIGSLLTGSIAAYANSGKAKRAKTRHVSMMEQQNKIGSIISTAAAEYTTESLVLVNIRVTDQNLIQVLELNTQDPELEKMLIKALQGRKIKGNYESINFTMNVKIIPEEEQSFISY